MDGSSPRPLSRGREGPCVALHDSGDDADYQRLDVCRRELAQWKARALEAEARLAAVAAVFGHTSNAGLASPTTVCLKDDQPMPRLLEIKGPAERRHDERKHAKPGPLSRTKRPAANPLPTSSSSTTTARSASTASEPRPALSIPHKESAPANANTTTTPSTPTIPAPTTVTSSAVLATSAPAASALATSRRSTRLNGRKVKVEDFSDDDEDSAVVRRKRPRLVMDCVLVSEAGKSRESTAQSSTPSASALRKKHVKVESPRKARVADVPYAIGRAASKGADEASTSASTSRPLPTSAPRRPRNSGQSLVPDAKALNAHPKSATLLSGYDREPKKLKLRVPARSKSVLAGPADGPHAASAAETRNVLQSNGVEGSRNNVDAKAVMESKEAVESQTAAVPPARAKSMFPDISAVKPTPSALASQLRHTRVPSTPRPTTQPATSRTIVGDTLSTQPQPPAASTSKLDAPAQVLNVHVPLPNLISASPSHLVPESYAKVPSVSRRFLLHLYGCNENSLLAFLHPKPYTNSRLHTQSSKSTYGPSYTAQPSRLPVAFANLNMNPHLPDRPGRTGVLLTRREDVLFGAPTALFVCRGVNEWQYVGDYVSKRVRPVTREEFCAMGYEVQRTWARSICSKKKPQCWGDMRAVVLGGNAQPRKDKFAEDEMLMALREGKTHLDVLLFECKRYTHDIAQDIQNWWDRREELQMLYTQGSGGQPRPVKLTKSTAKPKVASHFVPSTPGESPSPFNEPHKPRSPSKRARKRISMAGLDADDEDDDEDYCPDD